MSFCHNNSNHTDTSNTTVQSVIIDLIRQNGSKNNDETSLIIVLGDKSRLFIETELKTLLTKQTASFSNDDRLLTVNDIRHLDKDIKILFLNKLQYLFMYLTYLEVDKDLNSNKFQYDNIIIFGLNEQMLKVKDTNGKIEMVRLYQLILNSFYSLKHKFDNINKLLVIPYNNNNIAEENCVSKSGGDRASFKNIELQINNYCKYINGQ